MENLTPPPDYGRAGGTVSVGVALKLASPAPNRRRSRAQNFCAVSWFLLEIFAVENIPLAARRNAARQGCIGARARQSSLRAGKSVQDLFGREQRPCFVGRSTSPPLRRPSISRWERCDRRLSERRITAQIPSWPRVFVLQQAHLIRIHVAGSLGMSASIFSRLSSRASSRRSSG